MPTTKSRSGSRTMSTDSGASVGRPGAVSPSACNLNMDCDEEELSEAQMNFYITKKKAHTETVSKLEDMARAGAVITDNPDGSVTFKVTETSSALGPVTQQPVIPGSGQQYRLMVDQRTGRVLGSLPGAGGGQVRAPAPAPVRGQTPARGSWRGRGGSAPGGTGARLATPGRRGLSPRPEPQVVDLTRADPAGASGAGNTLRKTFPALNVTAKPQKVGSSQAKRSELDAKVKSLLVHTPAKFTEWLIQQGLVRSEQYDQSGGGKVKLKLGMYSDGKKFPHSGGYVWIQEGQSNKYTSVFKGSIFESASNQAPTVMLKLLYHWSCQTNITNVANWVKVDNRRIDDFFQLMRSVCVCAVQDEITQLGAKGPVEVGVISLGTTTADGQKREVKVEVLGVLDRHSRQIRLRASEPIAGASQTERFSKIFEMLPIWVNFGTRILTDFSVDKETLNLLGYNKVSQCSLNQGMQATDGNGQIMEYLKKIVPKMFQNTLSNLSTAVIQQFLDELTFREQFANYPLACFDGIIQRISSQTSALAQKNVSMSDQLTRVAADPFKDWRYSDKHFPREHKHGPRLSDSKSPSPAGKRASSEESEEVFMKRMKTSKELVNMESYYYATLPGDATVLATQFHADMAFKCPVTKKVFMNNLEFMKHLHLQVDTNRETAIDIADLSQCNYCFKDFDSEVKLQEHQIKDCRILPQVAKEYVDQITNTTFSSKTALVQHMMKTHVKYEMPYKCEISGYRSSRHSDIIEHFLLNFDRTDKLLCPYSLKVFSMYNEKGYNSAMAVTYLEHLQRMEDLKSKPNLQSKKSTLRFTDVSLLRAHMAEDFLSYKDIDGVEPYQYVASDEPIQMPKPDERHMKIATAKYSLKERNLLKQSSFAAQNLEDMAIYDAVGEPCHECGRSMTAANHYVAYLCCTKCRYSTCCSKSMAAHNDLFHGPAPKPFNLGKSTILKEPMYSVGGFSTTSGNKMAKHLATNGWKSAYPSRQEANRAKVLPEGYVEDTTDDENKDEEQTTGNNSEMEDDVEKSSNEDDQENKSRKTPDTNDDETTSENAESKEDDDEKDKDAQATDEKDENEQKTDDKADENSQPGPGGLLFGTFFQYMGDKKDDEETNEEKQEQKKMDDENEKNENNSKSAEEDVEADQSPKNNAEDNMDAD